MSDEISRTDWSPQSNDLIVADYFDMLKLELSGQKKLEKSARNKALQALINRSHGSIEFKHQNISAVMDRLGLPWIKGYKPRSNFQDALIDAVNRYLTANGQWLRDYANGPGSNAKAILLIGSPPNTPPKSEKETKALRRLVRKFDPAVRDARNRALGRQGEEYVFHSERRRLLDGGRDDLARKLEWTSEERGDGAGYDIHSFELDGKDRLIEVKTTNGSSRTPFYLSANELAFSEERREAFKLLRLHDFRDKPAAFVLVPPLDQWVKLIPSVYRASF